MAIKQRALMKLNTTKHHLFHGLGTGGKVALGEVCRNLTEARELYREGLPQQNYVAYGEICDGLVLAVRKMMEDGEADVHGEVLTLCQELLEHLEKETEKEQHFKEEIFFLPYKADMWDSLESVWKAAYEDKEHCNAYVMPIPYADRNTDGSIAEWHCERDRFPRYVPTLDWSKVDLKAWHPDIIFYHSPYDDRNLVTSVESRYYSRNLKECADKLVYIPYFILEEPCTEESVENFVLTPGVLNADKVIVQSEAMRELYIDILTKRTNQTDRVYWEKRISGAGSPKIEKVLTSKKEDFEMPEKWRRLVEGKKIILYNTSLAAMLQNSDKVCDKLRYVFDVFRNRDDVVLWWRPHPLMKATFHSMRPQFEGEYLALEKQYIEEGWGIYDDSSDLHRAICWSDAYYGDESSVVQLYVKTGKKVMLQSLEEWLKGISITNVVEFEGKLYFSAFNLNGIFKYDESRRELKKIENFWQYPLVGRYSRGLFYSTTFLCGKIYFFPYCADDIYSYDIRTGETKKFNMCVKDTKFPNEIARFTHIQIGDSVWMIRNKGSIIIRFDFVTETCQIFKKWYHTLEKETISNLAQAFFTDMIQIEQYLYFAIYKTNVVIRFSTETYDANVFYIGEGRYSSLAYDGDKLWLYSINTDVYCVDTRSCHYHVLHNVLRTSEDTGNTIIYRDGKIYAFQGCNMDYAIIDARNYMVSHKRIPVEAPIRTVIRTIGEKIYIMPFAGNSMGTILPDGSYRIDELKLEDSDIAFYRNTMNAQCLYDESNFIDLSSFLEDVDKERSNNTQNISRLEDSLTGQNIFSDMKEAL